MEWVAILIPVSFFALVAYIFGVVSGGRARVKIAQTRTDLQGRMLDKFATAAEFVEFAKTAEGQKLMEGAVLDRVVPIDRALRLIRFGTVFSFLGVGFAILTAANVMYYENGLGTTVLLLSLGVGMIVAAVTSRALAKSWGVELSHNSASE